MTSNISTVCCSCSCSSEESGGAGLVSCGQIAIARMHAYDAIFDRVQQRQRIVARNDRIARVVLHAKVGAVVDRVDHFEKYVLLLRKLGIAPAAVLVMVLHAQHHVKAAGNRHQPLNRIDHPGHALRAADVWIALPAEHAAGGARAAQLARDTDHFHFLIKCALACICVGVGEIGRTAQHGHGEAGRVQRLADRVEIGVVVLPEKAFIQLKALARQVARHGDPVKHRHAALHRNVVDVAFGKGGNFHDL